MKDQNGPMVSGLGVHDKKGGKANQRNYAGRTDVPDYGVPSGVQLTEMFNEEIVEAYEHETAEETAGQETIEK